MSDVCHGGSKSGTVECSTHVTIAHPCQFLVTCRASHVPHIIAKEDLFYRRARAEMDQAVAHSVVTTPQLFDAMRAATLIATWLFSRDQFVEVRSYDLRSPPTPC